MSNKTKSKEAIGKNELPNRVQLQAGRNYIKDSGILLLCVFSVFILIALVSFQAADPGWTSIGSQTQPENLAGHWGALISDVLLSQIGIAAFVIPFGIFIVALALLRIGDSNGASDLEGEAGSKVRSAAKVKTSSSKNKYSKTAKSISEVDAEDTKNPGNSLKTSLKIIGVVLFILSVSTLAGFYGGNPFDWPEGIAGTFGGSLSTLLSTQLGSVGGVLIATSSLLVAFTLVTEISWLRLIDWTGQITLAVLSKIGSALKAIWALVTRSWNGLVPLLGTLVSGIANFVRAIGAKVKSIISRPKSQSSSSGNYQAYIPENVDASGGFTKELGTPVEINSTAKQAAGQDYLAASDSTSGKTQVKIEPLTKQQLQPEKKQVQTKQVKFSTSLKPGLPSLDLLNPAEKSVGQGYSDETLQEMSELLERKLKDFGVTIKVVAVSPGPVITRFEIQPAPGVKASKISNLAKDLARSLAMVAVRVVEVIPGKSVMGIEVPNEYREIVYLSELLASKPFAESKSNLTLALGHDIAGEPVTADLAKMPHLLVAGTTGSGKSVGVNAMLLSLLYKSSPEDVRLIMVDPKMLELSVYDGIPHLLTPVITDMKDAANGLRWCVAEMERRYKLMAALGVRNIAGFNQKVKDAIASGQPIQDPIWTPNEMMPEEPCPDLETLPYIVVVIDEFADMIMMVGKKVEELIARLAQKARAAGIHLILATQRPSVDIITGLIKANVPTRIAFQVSSRIDSRTILDQGGAEQLLGHGDMLFLPSGSPIPVRVHGAFVDDDEVHRVVADWKSRGEPEFIDEIVNGGSSGGAQGSLDLDDGEQDALFDEAVAFVTQTRKASISSVQRKLRIGYNRAARLIETMESAGVVSPPGQNGSREVLAPPPVQN